MIKYTPILHNALSKDIDEKIKSEILDLITKSTSIDKAKSQLFDGLCELYAYLKFLDDSELKILFSQKKVENTLPYDLYDEGIKYLLNRKPLCEFLDLDIDHIKSKHEEVKAQLTMVEDMGKTTNRKIFYPILGGIWSILAEIELNHADQIKFICDFCELIKFDKFGQRHEDNVYVPPEDLRAYRKKDIDVVENWYDLAKPFMSYPTKKGK